MLIEIQNALDTFSHTYKSLVKRTTEKKQLCLPKNCGYDQFLLGQMNSKSWKIPFTVVERNGMFFMYTKKKHFADISTTTPKMRWETPIHKSVYILTLSVYAICCWTQRFKTRNLSFKKVCLNLTNILSTKYIFVLNRMNGIDCAFTKMRLKKLVSIWILINPAIISNLEGKNIEKNIYFKNQCVSVYKASIRCSDQIKKKNSTVICTLSNDCISKRRTSWHEHVFESKYVPVEHSFNSRHRHVQLSGSHIFSPFSWKDNCIYLFIFRFLIESVKQRIHSTYCQTFIFIFNINAHAQALCLIVSLELCAIALFFLAITFAFRVLFNFD